MKVLIYQFVLVVIILASCGKREYSEKPNFDFIEITRSNGWGKLSTIYIDDLWVIKRCDYHINNSDTSLCYIDTIDIELRKVIVSKLDSIKLIQIDTLYDGFCADCGAYIIRLGIDNKIIESQIIGIGEFNNEIASFSRLISNIQIMNNPIDSIIMFTTTKIFVPPPIVPGIKYYPPPDSLIY